MVAGFLERERGTFLAGFAAGLVGLAALGFLAATGFGLCGAGAAF